MNDVAWNKPAKFQIFIMRFDELINKIVIQDGGPPSWRHLEYFSYLKNYIYEISVI